MTDKPPRDAVRKDYLEKAMVAFWSVEGGVKPDGLDESEFDILRVIAALQSYNSSILNEPEK